MRTKLIRMADIESVLQKIGTVHIPAQNDLEEAIKKELTKGHLYYIEKDKSHAITSGNKVTLKIASKIAKFNKEKVSINVGTKLYSEVVENALIGLNLGSNKTVEINGETVEFTVLKVEELCYPKLTNDMVADKNIEGIGTVEQYKEYYLLQKQNETVRAFAQACLDEIIKESDFSEIDPLDVKEVTDQQFQVLRERFLQSELDLETMSEEEWIENFYNPEKFPYYIKIYPDIALLMRVRNKQEFYESLYSEGEHAILKYLVLSHILQKEKEDEFDPTKVLKAESKLMDAYVENTKEYLMKKEGC